MQNIALNIVLNGVPQAIQNLIQFEEVLTAARTQLSQLEIGSASFKKLSTEIKTADNTLRELKKQTEGKDLEGRLGDYGKLGGAIGSSFAAATAAIQLFGNGSEESLAAVTAAQNALTIALSTRGIAEGFVVVKTVANDIATKALAASTAATNSVTKAFYATLAANPYTAILAAVGLLIGVFAAFTSETKDATKAQKEFQDALNKDISKEITNFTVLADRVRNVNLTLESRKEAIEELRKIAPNYFKDLTDEQILQSDLKDAVNDVTEALIKQSTARALQSRVEETATKIIAAEDKLVAAKRAQIAAQQNLNSTIKNSISLGQAAGNAQQFAANASRVATDNVQKATQELNKLNGKRTTDLLRIQQIDGEIDRVLGGQVENEKDITKEKEKQVITNTKLLAQERELKKLQDALKAVLSFESVSEPTITKEQEKILNNLDSLIGKLQQVAPNIQNEFNKILNPDATQFQDTFKTIIDSTSLFLNAIDEIPVTFEAVQKVFKDTNLQGDLTLFTPEQKADVVSYLNTLKNVVPVFQDLSNAVEGSVKKTDEELFQIFAKQLNRTEEIRKKVAQGFITEETARIQLEEEFLKILSEQFNINEKVLAGLLKSNEAQTEANAAELKKYNLTVETVKILQEGFNTLVAFTTEVDKQGVIISENNKKIGDTAIKLKELINSLNPEQLSNLLQSIGFDFQSALTYVVTNAEKLGKETSTNFLKGVSQIPIELEKLSIKQLKNLKGTLEIAGTELEKYGVDTAAIFEMLFGKIELTIKEKIVANVISAIQQFQMVLNTLSQTTSAYFNSQFDTLEKRYKRITEGIVGDSEASNKKRIEAEKSYQAQRAKLEKQAAKASLRISLAQSAANTAEAITKTVAAYGGTPFAFIAAASVAALSAVQTGIIAQQLANIDSYRKGGMLKRQGGGMVFGPSHENGGVKFQQGGIELEGNESIINRVSTVNYMGLLSQINQSGGGRPIGPGYDDSRIVEAIAKQRNTPIRAYVVESDITAKQETARRLEKLSQI
jgi:hypothetical protein